MRISKASGAAVRAAAVTAVLATCVSAHRSSPPVPILSQPLRADALRIDVAVPDAATSGEATVVFIARARNGSGLPVRLMATLDGRVLARSTLPPGSTRRIYAPARLGADPALRVEFRSDQAGWDLMSLHVGSAYWSLDGPLGLDIAPSSLTRPALVPGTLLVPTAIVLRWIGTWRHAGRGTARSICRAVSGGAFLALTASLLVVWLGVCGVWWAPASFVALAALSYASELGPVVSRGPAFACRVQARVRSSRAWAVVRRRVLPLVPHVAVVALVLWSLAGFYVGGLGLTRLIAFGESFEPFALPALREVPHAVDQGGSGYDGQFYAQMALDPLLRDPALPAALDNPGYRVRRILFSATAYVAGLGRPQWILHVYAAQNIVCWLLLAVLLLRWLPPGNPRHVAAWAGCLLGQGLLSSLRFALLDGPSLLLVALAVAAVERGRGRFAALIVGLGGVGKETSLLSAGLTVERWRRPWLGAELALRAAIVVLPLVLWGLYLRWLGYGASSGAGNVAAPLAAYVEKWAVTLGDLRANGGTSFARFSLLTLVGLTTQAVVVLARWDWPAAWWRAGVGYAALFVVLGPAVWEGYPGAATRVLLPLTVAFNVLLPSGRWFWPLWVLGNLNILHGLELIRTPWISARV